VRRGTCASLTRQEPVSSLEGFLDRDLVGLDVELVVGAQVGLDVELVVGAQVVLSPTSSAIATAATVEETLVEMLVLFALAFFPHGSRVRRVDQLFTRFSERHGSDGNRMADGCEGFRQARAQHEHRTHPGRLQRSQHDSLGGDHHHGNAQGSSSPAHGHQHVDTPGSRRRLLPAGRRRSLSEAFQRHRVPARAETRRSSRRHRRTPRRPGFLRPLQARSPSPNAGCGAGPPSLLPSGNCEAHCP
jgi:hypothetical protein